MFVRIRLTTIAHPVTRLSHLTTMEWRFWRILPKFLNAGQFTTPSRAITSPFSCQRWRAPASPRHRRHTPIAISSSVSSRYTSTSRTRSVLAVSKLTGRSVASESTPPPPRAPCSSTHCSRFCRTRRRPLSASEQSSAGVESSWSWKRSEVGTTFEVRGEARSISGNFAVEERTPDGARGTRAVSGESTLAEPPPDMDSIAVMSSPPKLISGAGPAGSKPPDPSPTGDMIERSEAAPSGTAPGPACVISSLGGGSFPACIPPTVPAPGTIGVQRI
mmetsp:Transcript_18444/g.41542  ORF Transcript_18444/g.41542 Transcript_18444/m.41542 type:complete len:275 (-) Transcript_18444:2-826(-)